MSVRLSAYSFLNQSESYLEQRFPTPKYFPPSLVASTPRSIPVLTGPTPAFTFPFYCRSSYFLLVKMLCAVITAEGNSGRHLCLQNIARKNA